MRLAAVVLAPLLALPSLADARPVTAGIQAGVHHDKEDGDDEGNRTLGLFGRVGLTKRISGQLEVQRIDTDDQYWEPTTIRTGTVLLVVDLVDKGRLVPTLKVGAGLDRATTEWSTEDGHHYEGGFGLEYRAEGGFTVGIDLRMGGRSVDNDEEAVPVGIDDQGVPNDVAPLFADGAGLREGEYRSARLWFGIDF
jgi:hypothetical protein